MSDTYECLACGKNHGHPQLDADLYAACKEKTLERLRARVAELEAALPAAGRLADYAGAVISDCESDFDYCPDDFPEGVQEIWASLKADIAAVRAVTGSNE